MFTTFSIDKTSTHRNSMTVRKRYLIKKKNRDIRACKIINKELDI